MNRLLRAVATWSGVALLQGACRKQDDVMPLATGPLHVQIVRPVAGEMLEPQGAILILGAVGDGRASLTVNGISVPVALNGAFEMLLPPTRRARTSLTFVAIRGADTSRSTIPLRASVRAADAASRSWKRTFFDSVSVEPALPQWLTPEEQVRVGVRAKTGTRAVIVTSARRREALQRQDAFPGVARSRVDTEWPEYAAEIPAGNIGWRARLLLTNGSAHASVMLPGVRVSTTAGTWTRVTARTARIADRASRLAGADEETPRMTSLPTTDRGSWSVDGPPAWNALEGTLLETTGRIGSRVRVRLDAEHEGWISSVNLDTLPNGAAPEPVRLHAARVERTPDGLAVVVPVTRPVAYLIEPSPHALRVRFFAPGQGDGSVSLFDSTDFIRVAQWSEEPSRSVSLVLTFGVPYLGYRMEWTDGAMVLRVRRLPAIDRRHPLAGRVIAIDAGHPPFGALGPMGTREADVTWAVASKVRVALEALGAHVLMTRSDERSVTLGERLQRVEGSDAEVLISIHADAAPDGVEPREVAGTSTYYGGENPLAGVLAKFAQEQLIEQLGLRDRGIHLRELAMTHSTWVPAVLCEGASLVVPEQEWMLQSPSGQQRYAHALVAALVSFFRDFTGERSVANEIESFRSDDP